MSRSKRNSLESAPAYSVRCPKCGTPFDCGRDTKPFACWCASLPQVAAEGRVLGRPCLCPRCLAEALALRSPPLSD